MQSTDPRPAAIVCLAAGLHQVPVIIKSKAAGLAVLAVDQDPQAPGFDLADERMILSTWEPGPILERLREYEPHYRLVGVLNRSSGPPTVTAAEIARSLGLPGSSPDAARLVLDKAKLVAACADAGIAAPQCQSVSSMAQIHRAGFSYPAVVKPCQSLIGKSGVRFLDDQRELAAAFEHAMKYSVNGLVNIEEFVAGRDVSLLAVVQHGKLHPIAMLDEINRVDAEGNLHRHAIAAPSLSCGTAEEAAVLELGRKVSAALELDTSPFLLSCRVEPGAPPTLIELQLDIGGDLILDELIPAGTDFDALEFMIDALLHREISTPKLKLSPVAVVHDDGEVARIDGTHRVLRDDDRARLERRIYRMLEPRHA